MKTLNRFAVLAILCSIVYILGSCKKQSSTPVPGEKGFASPGNLVNGGCKPEVIGVLQSSGNIKTWTNIMQKWYNNGKLSFMKADLGWLKNGTTDEQSIIRWGEVIYAHDTVRLKDVLKNKIVLEAVLDAQGRAKSSTYFNTGSTPEKANYIYSTPISPRLTEINITGPIQTLNMIIDYDAEQNVHTIESLQSLSMNFIYVYTKPVEGMLGIHYINEHLKLMEYMDLIEFPLHHVLLAVTSNTGNWNYSKHRFTNDNRVYSYSSTRPTNVQDTFYVGWSCGSVPANKVTSSNQYKEISSMEAFRQKYLVPSH